MANTVELLLWYFLTSVSRALDLSYTGIMSHHQRVAVITAKVGQALGLSQESIARACQAALIHDLGVSTWGERAKLHEFEVDDPYDHALDGYRILTGAVERGAANCPDCRTANDAKTTDHGAMFWHYAHIILHHHDKWAGGNLTPAAGDAIPIESRIIHAADRLDVLLDESRPFNAQSERSLEALDAQQARAFDPDVIGVIKALASTESFWFDLEARFLPQNPGIYVYGASRGVLIGSPGAFGGSPYDPAGSSNVSERLSDGSAGSCDIPAGSSTCDDVLTPDCIDTLEALARVFADVVDRRSPYTHAHSLAVAECAFMMGKGMGLDDLTCRGLRVAGLLHDLGKMGVPEEILNKKGSLTGEEMCVVKRHAYLTCYLLSGIPRFGRIAKWAAFHHERMDGRGYPFRVDACALPLESRIIAVCDVFSALSEDRPYRPGLARDEVQRVLNRLGRDGALDKDIVALTGEALWEVRDLVAATGS